MVIFTKVTLGTRTTPQFISKEFYDCVMATCAINQYDHTFHPETIRYFVPFHQVVERLFQPCQQYIVELNDAERIPLCTRSNVIQKKTMTFHQPSHVFDFMKIEYEDIITSYFLLLPNATYYNTEIWTDCSTSHILYNGMQWDVHFRQVFTDPFNTAYTIWMSGRPKYQVQICVNADYRNRDKELKEALIAILPRAFKWHAASGTPLF